MTDLPTVGTIARASEYARDVPKSCGCPWEWSDRLGKYVRVGHMPGCVWHEGRWPT